MKNVKLTFDQIDEIVLSELRESLKSLMGDPWSYRHDLEESMRDVKSFLRVIEHFSTPSEFIEYSATLDYSKFNTSCSENIDIDITENEDGSANVNFSASEEQLKVLAAEGLTFLLMKAALGNVTNDQIMESFK